MARIRSIKPEFPQSESMGRGRDQHGRLIKKKVTAEMRRTIAKKCGCEPGKEVAAYCAYCGFEGSVFWLVQPMDRGPGQIIIGNLEIDHVAPEFRGGQTEVSNFVLACRPCNRSKGAKPLEQWRTKNGSR